MKLFRSSLHESVAISMTLLLMACVFVPAKVYSRYVGEPFLAHWDMGLVVFMFVCLLGYISGSRLATIYRPRPVGRIGRMSGLNPRLFRAAFKVWIFLVICWSLIYLRAFSVQDALSSLMGQGDVLSFRKSVAAALSDSYAGWMIPGMLASVVAMFACYVDMMQQGGVDVRKLKRYRLAIVCSVPAFILIVALTFTRAAAFYLIFEFWVVSRMIRGGGLFAGAWKYIAILFAALFASILMQELRDSVSGGSTSSFDVAARFFLGYIPGSVNRAAAILDGRMVTPGKDLAFYSFSWLWNFPGISRLFDVYKAAHEMSPSFPASRISAHYASFVDIANAGLNEKYNWPTYFGVAYSELGLASPVWFALFGFVTSVVYRSAIYGRNIVSMLVYPYLVLMVVLWLMGTVTFSRFVDIYIIIAVVIVWIGKSSGLKVERITRAARGERV